MKSGVVDARKVAGSGRLVFFWAEGEGVDVDAFVWGAGVALEWLDVVEVGSFALGEAVLAVELQLGGDDWVLAPAVHVEGGFGQDEGASVGDARVVVVVDARGFHAAQVRSEVGVGRSVPVTGEVGWVVDVDGASVLEEAAGVDEGAGVFGDGGWASKGVDGVWQGVDGVGVVEWLGTHDLEQEGVAGEGAAVVDVLVRLYDPNQFLDWVVEVQLDLVGRRPNGLVAGELQLSDQVFVWVLGHSATLVGVQENVVDVERGSNQGLVVRNGGWDWASWGVFGASAAVQGSHGPQALINGADIQVNLDFVVLQGNQWKGQAWVGAEPELQWDVQGGFWQGVARGAHLARSSGIARGFDVGKGWVGDKGQLGGVADHLEVPALLLGSHGQLIPDVHPVSVLAINALATDFDFDLGNQLLADVVQPTGIDSGTLAIGVVVAAHHLVDLWQDHLQIGWAGSVTVAGQGTCHAASKVGLALEGLLNRFEGEVGMSLERDLPKGNLGVAS